MKLTRSQRLFIEGARTEYLAQRYKFTIACTRPHEWHQKKIELLRYETGELKRLRALRKRLLREALKEWRDEADNLFIDGYQTCFKRTKEWELYSTEHT